MKTVNPRLPLQGKKIIDHVLNLLIVIFSVLVVLVFIFNITHKGIYVVHSSMYPTLIGAESANVSGGDYVYVNMTIDADYGDIVVVYDSRYSKIPLIKRAIAFEGDTVKIEGGTVYIRYGGTDEFVVLDEPYVAPECNLRRLSYDSVTVGDGEIYLLGDNRDVSDDSRQHGTYLVSDMVGVTTDFLLSIKSFSTAMHNFFNF